VEKVLYYLNPHHETIKFELSKLFSQCNVVTKKDDIKAIINLIMEYSGYTPRNVQIETIANDIFEVGKIKHAESNLGNQFSFEKLYTGISKLCCGICDNLLNTKYHHEHRGTHGTCDPKWGAPTIQFLGFLDELRHKSIGIDQSNRGTQLNQQHRQLSHDNLKALLTGVEIPDQNFMFQHYKDILLSGEMVEY
jgi:hypothetical protein